MYLCLHDMNIPQPKFLQKFFELVHDDEDRLGQQQGKGHPQLLQHQAEPLLPAIGPHTYFLD